MNLIRVLFWGFCYFIAMSFAMSQWPSPYLAILSGAAWGDMGRVIVAALAGLVSVRIR